jgi:NAD(P)-dependent dehydrogenase (short-subunit alcohol dehydrogenase family)
MSSMQAKVVLITGAAGGIGSAVARVFAKAGARLALLDSDGVGLERLTALLREQGTVCQMAVADLSTESGVRDGIGVVLAPFDNQLDVLVANVGQLIAGRFETLPTESWRRSLAINLLTHVWAIQCAVTRMQTQGRGCIVVTGSDQGLQADIGLLPYSACKAALHALVKTLARELAPSITISAVAPGMTRTPLVEKLMQRLAEEFGTDQAEAERLELARRGVPLNRLGEPEEVAQAIYFLATLPFATGTILNLSGGNVRSVAS